jgi:5-formyltetrahydrofolate cyclo-ligase
VQQQLQLLGSMLLHDPRMKLAKVKQQQQRRHSSSAAAASQQQQALTKLQQTLPLAAVCLRAMQGCHCSLDELQAEFKAAAEKIGYVVYRPVCVDVLSCFIECRSSQELI